MSGQSPASPQVNSRFPRTSKQHNKEGTDIEIYMDINKTRDKQVPSELTRELLIAISQSVPENILNSKRGYEDLNGVHGTAVVKEDRAEELRSKLILISNLPQPENIVLPKG
ncbi:hypothetical protein Dimus_008344 [Dionaea muscipula]